MGVLYTSPRGSSTNNPGNSWINFNNTSPFQCHLFVFKGMLRNFLSTNEQILLSTPPQPPGLESKKTESKDVGHLFIEPLLSTQLPPFSPPWWPRSTPCRPRFSPLETFFGPRAVKAQVFCWFSPKFKAGGRRRRIWWNRKLYRNKINVKLCV